MPPPTALAPVVSPTLSPSNLSVLAPEPIAEDNALLSFLEKFYADVVAADDGTGDPVSLIMNGERILQIYALSVFQRSFGRDRAGNSRRLVPRIGRARVPRTSRGGRSKGAVAEREGAGQSGVPEGELRGVRTGVEGELQVELVFLEDLEALDVSHNQVGRTLQPAMFHWKHMKSLDLNDH